jgi:peptidoglycan/LPS O-acetylase OafA/YrhL
MPLLVTALYLGVLVVVASISYRWIEKPAQDWFRAAVPARGQAETA